MAGIVGSLPAIATTVAVFFAGYFIAYEPYRALYPDVFGDEVAGRAQGNQAVWRGVGTAIGLVAGGALLSVANFVPFVAAALVLVAVNIGFTVLLLRYGDPPRGERRLDAEGVRQIARRVRRLLSGHPAVRHYLAANTLWELALAPIATDFPPLLNPAVPVIAFGGGMIMGLPYAS